MFIISRFIWRTLFGVLWLFALMVAVAGVLALMAIAGVSVACLLFSAVLGVGYWVKHDPEMGWMAAKTLFYGLSAFGVLVATEGLIWDGFRAVWKPHAATKLELQIGNGTGEQDFQKDRSGTSAS
jgi:hypothetical protein